MNLLLATQAEKGAKSVLKKRHHLWFAILGVASVGLSGCGGGGGHSAGPSPAGETQQSVVFQSNRDGDFEILRMNRDGSRPTRVTNNSAVDIEPSLSPDGQRIVFVSDRVGSRQLFIIDAQGTQQLTNDISFKAQPKFSADGKNIVFRSTRAGNTDIFSIGIQSKIENRITLSNFVDQDATFSPSGGILFSSNQSNNFFQIYEINADGQQLKKITTEESNHFVPSVSPDNKYIVFASDREGSQNIYLLERATGIIKALTSASKNNTEPTFSRDGQRIFFSSDRNGNSEIYSMNLAGGEVRNLTNNPASDRVPSVQ